MSGFLSFRLSEDFINEYKDKKVEWGLQDAGGTSFAEIVFLRTYSRKREDGSKETWQDVCRRVVEGTYSIQKNWAKTNQLPWNDNKAAKSAQEMFERMFKFKWTPPGRGLATMGTPMVNESGYSTALQNCGAISLGKLPKNDPGAPFAWLMSASMCGVGIGYSLIGVKELDLTVRDAKNKRITNFTVPDSREGWAEATRLLINAYLTDSPLPNFDYSEIRPEGALIKSFGTPAPGPAPLIKLHAKMTELLDNSVDNNIDSVLVSDIANLIGKCVVSGNTRRSALLAYGELDDEDFTNLKNWKVFPERNGADGWSWMSNNSVRAHSNSDLTLIAEGIKLNGEPGIIWEDVVKTRGRLVDPPDDKDAKFVSFNPCLTASSDLLTTSGWRKFGTAAKEATPNTLIVDSRVTYSATSDGKEHPKNWIVDYAPGVRGVEQEASEVFLTQKNAKVVTLTTKEGYEVTLTPDHLVATTEGMVPAGELIEGTEILLTAGSLPSASIVGQAPQSVEEIEAALMGLIAGDGTFSGDKAVVSLWSEDKTHSSVISNWIEVLFEHYQGRIVSDSNRPLTACNVIAIESRDQIMISSTFLAKLLESKYGFKQGAKHVVPEKIMENSRSYGRYYIAALAFADGTVNRYNKVNSSSVRIGQSNKKLLQQIQKMLLSNGIASTIYLRRHEGQSFLPDGKGGNKFYPTKAFYELLIMNHKYEYGKFIGFLGSRKDELTKLYLNTPSRKRSKFTARIESVIDAGREDVYCLREPVRRILCADGITMRRCAEQPLENKEFCTLSDIYVNNHESLEDFKRSIKFAFLYAKTVTLLPTHFEESNAVMQKNRRIGLSLSGCTDFIDERLNGLQQLRGWFDEGYKTVRYYDKLYSEWLCVRESNRVTTVKPGGTTGIVASTSSGIHWTDGGEFYNRALRIDNGNPMLPWLKMSGHLVEADVMNPDTTSIVYFPIKSRSKRSARKVSLFEKAALAVEAQRLWSDNGVSVTLTFDSVTEAEAVPTVLNMYAGQLKAVSFMPVGNAIYPQQPYTEISQDDYDTYANELFPTLLDDLYANWEGSDIEVERGCATDVCEIKAETS
jgi:ribonucleotide reductase alpha subunit